MLEEKKKIIFIHYTKCGGESIEHAIFGKSDTCYNGDTYEGTPTKHWGCKQYISHHGQDFFDNCFVFTFVRNPWERVISRIMYRNKRFNRPIETTPELIKQEYKINEIITDDLLNNDNTCLVNYVGRFERLQQDFNTVCNKIDIPPRQLPHHNKTNHKHYTEYYDNETRKLVAERYARDIEYFDYKFGE